MILGPGDQRPNGAVRRYVLEERHEHAEELVVRQLGKGHEQREALTNQLDADARRPFLERLHDRRGRGDHAVAQERKVQIAFFIR